MVREFRLRGMCRILGTGCAGTATDTRGGLAIPAPRAGVASAGPGGGRRGAIPIRPQCRSSAWATDLTFLCAVARWSAGVDLRSTVPKC
jgi:hypothetical protein